MTASSARPFLPSPDVAAQRPTTPVATADPPGDSPPFALVELFTSEGCSSCPSADGVLRELHARGAEGVMVLSFHVDYWNELGWPDPWSSADNTERQQAYARTRGDRGLFTPQMVIDGTDAFVGSDRGRAREGVERSLAARPTVSVRVHLEPSAAGSIVVAWDVRGAPARAELAVALAEDGLESHVGRGENAGRTLHHDGVVRKLSREAIEGSDHGRLVLDVPADLHRDRARVVAFVSRRSFDRVLGAATAALR